MPLPLSGLRVLAVEQYGAGPFGTQFLAQLGAEVIKIESPDGGDVSRSLGPYYAEGVAPDAASLFFQSFNHNKKSITLNLKAAEGREVFARLAAGADAVACNLRGDVPARLGLTYPQLKRHNPRLVCAHLTAYGRSGARAAWPGYDYMMQAEAGYFMLTGEPETPPARFGLSVIDFMTGLGMAYALTAALLSAQRDGVGRDVDISLFDMALYNLNYLALWFLNAGHAQQRAPRSAHASLTPCQLYRSRDGWIYLMCNKEKFWPLLCEHIGRPELAADPRFANFSKRLENRALLTELLDAELAKRSTAEWLRHFDGAVPAAPVNDLRQALENPFAAQSGLFCDLPLGNAESGAGALRILANPVRCGETLPPAPAPRLGEHTDSVLREAGFDDSTLQRLRAGKVI